MDYLKTIDIASMTNVLNHGVQIKESIGTYLPCLARLSQTTYSLCPCSLGSPVSSLRRFKDHYYYPVVQLGYTSHRALNFPASGAPSYYSITLNIGILSKSNLARHWPATTPDVSVAGLRRSCGQGGTM
jgi:hypothetical protein